MVSDDEKNPLDELISFPDNVVYLREDTRPDESHGWGVHLLLDLPRSIVEKNLATQLSMAGFVQETSAGQPGLLRFIRDDAYVWGMIGDAPDRRVSLFVSLTLARPEAEDAPPPDWRAN